MNISAVPGAPEFLEVTAVEKDSASFRWKRPKNDGGASISAYIIEKREEFKDTWVKEKQVDSFVHSHQARDLVPENKYYFRVSAKNSVGVGEPATLSQPVVPSKPIGEFC